MLCDTHVSTHMYIKVFPGATFVGELMCHYALTIKYILFRQVSLNISVFKE